MIDLKEAVGDFRELYSEPAKSLQTASGRKETRWLCLWLHVDVSHITRQISYVS